MNGSRNRDGTVDKKPVDQAGSGGETPPKPLLVLCDFDGTVCRIDMGNAFLERFATGWEEIDRAYAAGEVGSRIAYGRIAPLFRANRLQATDFVLRHERLDPSFPGFLAFCQSREIDLKIVSDGLDFYIGAILDRHGLDVEFYSNRLRFRKEDRADLHFPWASRECGRCGTCKHALLAGFRSRYQRIIYIGDGYSDVCPARSADQVFAKPLLHQMCRKNGTHSLPYHDFNDIRRCLAADLGVA